MANKLSIKKNDIVIAKAGKNKGKTGKVLYVLTKKNRVVVEGVNFVKKAKRPSQQDQKGGITDIESPMHVSNVMLVCPKCSKPARIGIKVTKGGRKNRVCKKCKEEIDKK